MSDEVAPYAGSPAVVVYWRPGCPYCVHLRWGLRRLNIETEEFDNWSDSQAAAIVRSANDGNETVPTVVVGTTTLLNPTPRQVQRELERQSTGPDSK